MAAPTFTFGMLITFVAIARWNLWGMIVIPFMAAANVVGGMFNDIDYLKAMYTELPWQLFISTVIGFLPMGINVIFYKKFTTKKVLHDSFVMIGLVLLNYGLFCLFQFLSIRLLTTGSIFEIGEIIVNQPIKNPDTGVMENITHNICVFAQSGYIYNLLGLFITIIGLFILRSQGVVNNVVDKLIDDKKMVESNLEDEKNFSIAESESKDDKTEPESHDTNDSDEN